MLTIARLLLLLLFLPLAAPARQESPAVYETLLTRLKKGDLTVDFTALRYASVERREQPGAEESDPAVSRSMFASLRDKKYEEAIKYAESVLAGNYLDINAHFVAAIAYEQLNNRDREKYHRGVADGLVKSIFASGDGKSQESAYTVISTDEEYVILRVLGLVPGKQSLLEANGHYYDRLDAVERRSGKTVTLFFNIDRPYGALKKMLRP